MNSMRHGVPQEEGCQEPMSDKQVLYNHVRLLENTPARAVIHYRFPLVDVNKVKANYVNESGWYDVADWYYYIYPDGIAAKVEQLWTSGKRDHEWQESMAIFGPDQHPHDLIERDSTFTLIRIKDGVLKPTTGILYLLMELVILSMLIFIISIIKVTMIP